MGITNIYAALAALVLAIALFAAGFLSGRASLKLGNEQAQVAVLKQDATSVIKIEKQESARHAKNTTILDQAKIEIHDDDFNRPISADAIKRLCDLGAHCP